MADAGELTAWAGSEAVPRSRFARLLVTTMLTVPVFACAQLNGGVLVFLLLCIACVAVWSRLLVLWCTFRAASHCAASGAFSRRRRRFARRFGPAAAAHMTAAAAQQQSDDIKEGLEAPLLNPLRHEEPFASALFSLHSC